MRLSHFVGDDDEREKKNVYIFYDTHSVASRDRCVVGAVEQARCAVG